MILRSFLFVPGDSERKQAKAVDSHADALLLDLEDSVAAPQLPAARQRVRELLTARSDRSKQQLWVRVNALSSGLLLEDLVAVFPGAPDGLVLPKVVTPADITEVGHYLTALEAREGRAPGATKLLIIATETPQAVLNLNSYAAARAHPGIDVGLRGSVGRDGGHPQDRPTGCADIHIPDGALPVCYDIDCVGSAAD